MGLGLGFRAWHILRKVAADARVHLEERGATVGTHLIVGVRVGARVGVGTQLTVRVRVRPPTLIQP